MNIIVVPQADGRKVTSLEVATFCGKDRAMNLASWLKGYMIDDVCVAPCNSSFHVTVVSKHEDAPTELAGFVMMVLAYEASK